MSGFSFIPLCLELSSSTEDRLQADGGSQRRQLPPLCHDSPGHATAPCATPPCPTPLGSFARNAASAAERGAPDELALAMAATALDELSSGPPRQAAEPTSVSHVVDGLLRVLLSHRRAAVPRRRSWMTGARARLARPELAWLARPWLPPARSSRGELLRAGGGRGAGRRRRSAGRRERGGARRHQLVVRRGGPSSHAAMAGRSARPAGRESVTSGMAARGRRELSAAGWGERVGGRRGYGRGELVEGRRGHRCELGRGGEWRSHGRTWGSRGERVGGHRGHGWGELGEGAALAEVSCRRCPARLVLHAGRVLARRRGLCRSRQGGASREEEKN